VVPLPAEATGLDSPGIEVGARLVLRGMMVVGTAAFSVVTSAVEMTGTGSAVVTTFTRVGEAWLKIIVVSSVVTVEFVPFDVTWPGVSEALRGIVLGTSVVTAGEVCCATSELFDDTSTTLEAEDDTGSLVIPLESMIMLDTAGTSVGDAWASVVTVDTLNEDTLDDSGRSDCCDSIPVSIAVVIEGTSEDSSDAPEATSEGCAEMIKDGSWIDVGSPVAWLVGDVSAVAVSMNRKLVVGAGPSE
jgi:hypothetical protein